MENTPKIDENINGAEKIEEVGMQVDEKETPSADKPLAVEATTTTPTPAAAEEAPTAAVIKSPDEKGQAEKNAEEILNISAKDNDAKPSPAKRAKKSSLQKEIGKDVFARISRRKIKEGPKLPVSGYVRFMQERREPLRKENPNKTANQHTSMISEEWNALTDEQKAPYNEAARLEMESYNVKLETFFREHPDILKRELASNKKSKSSEPATEVKGSEANGNASANRTEKQRAKSDLSMKTSTARKRKRTPLAQTSTATTNNNNNSNNNNDTSMNNHNNNFVEIQIYTYEFIEHNKIIDNRLRILRKSKSDIEQQTSLLEKNMESTQNDIDKLSLEADDLDVEVSMLQKYLNQMKCRLAKALSDHAIPTYPKGANMQNVDDYMTELHRMYTSNSHGPACLNKARDILRKLDMQITLTKMEKN